MSGDTEQRKLAAIMFTDMVGYSALAQRDDKLALELLEEHRQLLREIFPRFNGTDIKTIGDAFLIEFNSALEAAQCAIEIQRTLAKRNHDVNVDRRIELRIGVHIGDVVHRGGDVYGDGVNIASRIERLAGAGGICVSMDVERQIRNALEARFEKLAPTELKNISVPMDLFRIVLPWEQRAKAAAKSDAVSRPNSCYSLINHQGAIRVHTSTFCLCAILLLAALSYFGQSTRATASDVVNPPTPKGAVHLVVRSDAEAREIFTFFPYPPRTYGYRGVNPRVGVYRIEVTPDGTVSAVTILKSVNEFMDVITMKTLVRWRAKPGPLRVVDVAWKFSRR